MFKRYTSIENSYRDEFLDRIKSHGFWEDDYVVQEKVHGSNLSIWTTDGDNFYIAKRTGLIEENEQFFNHDLVLESIKENLKQLWIDVNQKVDDLTQLTVFGELFGGYYPHSDVEPDRKAIRVQKEIFYSPDNRFYAFDLMINATTFLDLEQANQFFESCGLMHAKTLFKGSLQDCLAYPNDFTSYISRELNLPDITPNIAEGVVIKPVYKRYFNNGVRVILKNKNEKWAEKKKFDKIINPADVLPEKVLKLQEAILTYVTENRFKNVVSKLGTVNPSDFGRVLGLFNKDLLDDFLKDYHSITDELDKKELKLVTKSFNSAAAALVKAQLQLNM